MSEPIGGAEPEPGAIAGFHTEGELRAYRRLAAELTHTPIPSSDLIAHLGLFLDRSSLGHVLFVADLYRRILPVHGAVLEFGVRWGRNLALLSELRNIYEPRNALRRIVGFDTFEGFPAVSDQDGDEAGVARGSYSVSEGYRERLETILAAHEQFGLRPHVRKFELVTGDVAVTLPDYLRRAPETVVALAYLDLDLYAGTVAALDAIRERLVKGSVVAFDEVCMRQFPGETQAIVDTWGLRSLRLQRTPEAQNECFAVID